MRIIHGHPEARTNYVIWALKELGLDYEINPVSPMAGDTKKPDFLALNPNGLVPVLEEDGFILWESAAINFYLAKNYGDGLLWSDDAREEALIMQWCVFGTSSLDGPAVDCLLHKFVLPEEMRDADCLCAAEETLALHAKVLDGHLAGKDYLVAERFTLADLNLAAILEYPRKTGYDFSATPHVQAWLARCLERPMRVEMSAK
ncbi:MAG: glutathione S-transferase [Alphaproteobacteria bacterium]|nr:MAG: glutathione S-transferase [Alphaproteobacteria bacterium]